MSTIQKRSNKTCTITVSIGYDATGRQIRRTKTIEADSKLTPKQSEKLVQQEVVLFEAGAGKELQERKRGKALCAFFDEQLNKLFDSQKTDASLSHSPSYV